MQRLPFTFASLLMLLVSSLSTFAQGADVLKVAVSPWYYPVIFEGEGGAIQGVDPEVAQAIAAKLGLKAEFVVMARDKIGAAIAAGEADIGLSAIESRSYLRDYNNAKVDPKMIKLVDYFEVPASFVVRKEETGNIGALAGKPVAGLAYHKSRETLSEWQTSGLVGKVFGFENEGVLVNTFKLKRVQGILVTLPTAHELAAGSGGQWKAITAEVKGKKIKEPIALILPASPADAGRGKKIADAVEAFHTSGKIAEIAAKWISNP